MKWLLMKITVGILVLFLAFGCGRRIESKPVTEPLAVGAENDLITPKGGFVSAAVKATGGLKAWMEVKEVSLECVVTFYKPDKSLYLTEQVHQIYPWSNSIRISAEEPEEKFICQLSRGKFSILKTAEKDWTLPVEIEAKTFARAVLDIMTAPIRFLDKSAVYTERRQFTKIEGQIYWPVIRTVKTEQGDGAEEGVIFCQNQQSSLIDVVWYSSEGSDGLLTVRGYNYIQIKDNGIVLPRRVEIFRASSDGVLQKRLAKIEYHW